MITSAGKQNPAKVDLDAGTRRERRRINLACLILFSTDATVPPRDVHNYLPVARIASSASFISWAVLNPGRC